MRNASQHHCMTHRPTETADISERCCSNVDLLKGARCNASDVYSQLTFFAPVKRDHYAERAPPPRNGAAADTWT